MALQHRYVGVVYGRLIRKQKKNIVKLLLFWEEVNELEWVTSHVIEFNKNSLADEWLGTRCDTRFCASPFSSVRGLISRRKVYNVYI